MFNKEWDFRFLNLAKEISSWSKDKSTGCGAILVRPDKSIASVGFNGLAATIPAQYEDAFLDNRETKIQCILHAEINALLLKRDDRCDGYTIYTYPLFTCAHCCSALLQAGVKRFISIQLKPDNPRYLRWKDSFKLSYDLLTSSDVQWKQYEDFE